jgi:hypothetical protein
MKTTLGGQKGEENNWLEQYRRRWIEDKNVALIFRFSSLLPAREAKAVCGFFGIGAGCEKALCSHVRFGPSKAFDRVRARRLSWDSH